MSNHKKAILMAIASIGAVCVLIAVAVLAPMVALGIFTSLMVLALGYVGYEIAFAVLEMHGDSKEKRHSGNNVIPLRKAH